MVPLKAVVLKHQNAPVNIREILHYDIQQIDELIIKIQDLLGLQEFFVLSTCNRTEVYYISENNYDKELVSILCHQKGIFEIDNYSHFFTFYQDPKEALLHLFSVSIGLESVVLGDLQIIHQVKQAYIQANQHKIIGPFFHRMFHAIFHANKRVQNETELKSGSASVAYAGAEICYEITQNLNQPKILIIGLGEIGRNLTENLLENFGLSHVFLSNRTIEKTITYSQKYPIQVIPFEQVPSQVHEFDIVISAISVHEPFIQPEWFIHSTKTHYLIDLGVPRSIHPDIEKLGNILFNIDDIQYRVNEALESRKKSIPRAKQIVEEEVQSLINWSKELVISPVIQQIKESLEQIRKEELAKYMNKVDEKSMKFMEEITQSMVQKIIKYPVLQLKAACKRGEEETLVEALKELFTIEKKEVQVKK